MVISSPLHSLLRSPVAEAQAPIRIRAQAHEEPGDDTSVLASGAWSDVGSWDDGRNWNDGV